MYYGQNSMLPLYYRIYPGSIPDKAHLRYMTEDTGVISCKKARYVMDRGFYSAENLKYLAEKNCRFIIALPASLKYCRELIERHKSEIINRYEYSLGVGKPYGKVFEVTDLGFRMNVHMYYDADKAARDAEVIRMEVEKIEAELREMEEPPARNLHYDKYFFINRNSKDDSLSFRRNDAAINKSLDQCGFFLIAETDFKKTTAEILDIYRRRDIIEKSFDSLKNDIDMKRLYIHSDEIAEGKTFVAFLALIVRSQMHNLLQKYMYDNRYTFRKILLELDKAKLIIAADRISGCRLLNPPSKTLRDILSLLGCDTNSLSVV
jgi:transposase